MNDAHIDKVIAEKGDDEPLYELVIAAMRDGRTVVSGPIGNKAMCYGMLEMAKDIIRQFKPKKGSGIIIPGVEVPPEMGG